MNSAQIREDYITNGWVVLPDFLDRKKLHLFYSEFNCLMRMAFENKSVLPSEINSECIDTELLLELAKSNRSKLGGVYRSCRHLPSLQNILMDKKNLDLAKDIMKTEFLNICPYNATRIDLKGEEKYLFGWHQDYHYIQGSIDGIVLWCPLTPNDKNEGIEILNKSHLEGISEVSMIDSFNAMSNGSKTMKYHFKKRIFDLDKVIPQVRIGDVVLFSTLLVHRSLPQANPVRVSTQFRYGNFTNDDSVARLWPVGQLEGRPFDLDHPEYIIKDN